LPTYTPKPGDVVRSWHVIDASDIVLGRLASQAARLLRGEYRYRHSGYPGGLSKRTVGELLESKPERLVELAVKGMLPKNTLGRAQLKKLKVYSGPSHPHAAQTPKEFQITQVAQ
jgi:large subunit ribosomal protein L13